ncbi:DNA polymerase III subunit delta [Parvularcula dongshanensis]|uniref:DNA-directed DNA polymerase n=1 Tax=Parvularcula dongshanensis TaxID=1173995 RepID=A0A840I1E7_9PROT|nr:DNA polymerase-3 subunit delta [Parvularcula dongshanensis]
MTAIAPRDVKAFLQKRHEEKPVVLVYGPDQGLVRERAAMIGRQVVADPNDPWAATEFAESDLSEPGRLADEAQALSFGGGDRLVRVRGGGEPVTKAVTLLLNGIEADSVKPASVVVIEAGDLKKTSGLRKACEKSKRAAVIACYADDARDVVQTVKDALAQEDLTITDEALMAFVGRLGDDRGVTRSEIEKLILYAGPKSVRAGPAQIGMEEVAACRADDTQDATFEVWERAAVGDAKGLSEALHRAEGAGASLLGILRIAQGKLLRLLAAARLVENGQPPAAAMKALRPPVFYGEQRAFGEQLKRWDVRRLEAAAEALLEADLAAKRTGAPQKEVVERALLRIAAQARR